MVADRAHVAIHALAESKRLVCATFDALARVQRARILVVAQVLELAFDEQRLVRVRVAVVVEAVARFCDRNLGVTVAQARFSAHALAVALPKLASD